MPIVNCGKLRSAALTMLLVGPLPTACGAQAALEGVTTLYVNKYFEMREHEAPTKYIFNGNTRIARVTGSLTTNARLQRLRVYPGWNLCSLAVTASNTLSQLLASSPEPAVEALYRWVPQGSNYIAVLPGETLPEGSVVWLKAPTNANLSLVGAYSDPNAVSLTVGGNFIASAGLEDWTFTNALPPGVSAWKHDTGKEGWSIWFAGPLQGLSDFAGFVAPGEAVFAEAGAPAMLEVPDGNLRIIYYHQDHLGSSSVTTDASGNFIQEDSFYPFGSPRIEYLLRNVQEDYGFTQKERDQESALAYFDARYLTTLEGRFLSPDPLVEVHNTGLAQSWNCYAYALNNPVKYTDPHGLYVLDPAVNADQGKAIEQAFKEAREAAGKIENAADRDLLIRALDAYKGNNVTIGIDPALANEKAAGRTSSKGGGKFQVNFMPGLSGPHLLKQMAHEGSHLADKEAGLLQTTYDSEKKAYTVESILFQGKFLSQSPNEQKASDYRVLHYEKRIWDFHWQSREEVENKRSAAIDLILAKPKEQGGHYGVTPDSPGPKSR